MSYVVLHTVIDQYCSGNCKINIEGNSVEVIVDYDFQPELPVALDDYARFDQHDHYGDCDTMFFNKEFWSRSEALSQVSLINNQFDSIGE